jgi:hypothetical protein
MGHASDDGEPLDLVAVDAYLRRRRRRLWPLLVAMGVAATAMGLLAAFMIVTGSVWYGLWPWITTMILGGVAHQLGHDLGDVRRARRLLARPDVRVTSHPAGWLHISSGRQVARVALRSRALVRPPLPSARARLLR